MQTIAKSQSRWLILVVVFSVLFVAAACQTAEDNPAQAAGQAEVLSIESQSVNGTTIKARTEVNTSTEDTSTPLLVAPRDEDTSTPLVMAPRDEGPPPNNLSPANCSQTIGSWTEVANAPIDHLEGGFSVVINNKLYVFGGFYTPDTHFTTDRVDVYNPVTDVWETATNPLTPIPISASHMLGAVYGDEVWLVGGFIGRHPGPPTDDVWRYNYVTDSWLAGPDLPAPRGSGGLALVGNILHYFGGLGADRMTDQADHYVLDLDNPVAWTTAASMPQARNHFGTAVIDGLIYAFGGQFDHDDLNALTDVAYVHVYNPATDTWTALSNMPNPRSHAETAVVVSHDRVMVFGGRNLSVGDWAKDTTLQYNPQTDSWTNLPIMPEKTFTSAAGVVVNALGNPGKYVVLTNGGRVWNGDQIRTWIAPIVSDCPVIAPTIDAGTDQTITDSDNNTSEDVILDATATDSDGTVEVIDWKLNGNVIASSTLTPTVNLPVGVHLLTLEVIDSDGQQAIDTVTITVLDADTTVPVISLTLPNPQTIEAGADAYVDPGYSATDDRDGDITGNVIVTGTVNPLVPGNYTLVYDVADAAGNHATTQARTIIVEDTTPPTVTLLGDDLVELTEGDTYSESGAEATDTVDGTFTVTDISGIVDTNTPGNYTVTYNAMDTAGNSATPVARNVTVNAPSGNSTTVLDEPFDNSSQFTSSELFFSDGSGDYFGISDGGSGIDFGSGSAPSALKAYTGFTGNFLTGMDMDGEGATLPITLTWSGLDITGLENLQFSGDFAEFFDSPGDIDPPDTIRIEYQIDGGGYQNLLWFSGADFSTSVNGIFREDTDFDGTGDGIVLGNAAQTFTKAIAGTGSTLDLRLTLFVDSGDEDFGLDSFAITGEAVISAPPLVEPFDDASQFTSSELFFSDGSGDYFGISDGGSGIDFGSGSAPSALKAYTGFTGNFLTGMDMDGEGATLPITLTWSGLDITGLENLQFSGDFAEFFDSPGDIDPTDTIRIEYQIDGGGYQNLLWFSGADFSSSVNGIFREDTDFDGTGDGIALGNAVQTFTKAIAGTGSTLDLRLTLFVDSGDEDFGLDNFIIDTGQVTQQPELTLNIDPATFSEADSVLTGAGTVTRTGDTSNAVIVSLSSDDETEVTVPATVTILANESSATFDVTPVDDSDNDDTQTVTITATATDYVGDSATLNVIDDEVVFTKIHDIQGSNTTIAVTGLVSVEAIVVGDYQGSDQLSGFFIQEEDADADANANTSEGIFVYCGACAVDVAVGDLVQVTGEAEDYFNMSQIDVAQAGSSGTIAIVSSSNPLPTPATIDLPVPTGTDQETTFESIEGMLVTFVDTLTVSEYFELARYGQIILSEGGRPHQFTDITTPDVTGYATHLADLAKRQIILDDDNNVQNEPINADTPYYHPIPGLSDTNFFRGGDTITNLTGVLHWSYAGQSGTDAWRIRPVPEAFNYDFTPVNVRTATPTPVGGTLKVASFNVLNYFTTIDTTSSNNSGPCAPSGTQDCRGADNASELVRQTDKIVSAICAIDADILGLIEIENNATASLAALTTALNAQNGCGPYAYVNTGTIGSDAIKVAFIYKTTTVSTVGSYAILDSSVDASFIDTKNRPALAQTFAETSTGGALTVVVNHLKSKGSNCDSLGDPDLNDGQANCSQTRTSAAIAIANWLATDPTGSGDDDFLIIGDLNSYRNEDPIVALENKGYTDLIDLFGGASAYSYVFDSQLGYLDYAMANASLVSQVTGVTEWHINADEIPLFDYNDDIKDTGEAAYERESSALDIYEPDAYRASDHDPVIVGLNLSGTTVTHTITATAGTGGSISPAGAVIVNDGDNQSFTITAASGYEIADVVVDNVSQGAINSYEFQNVTEDHTIAASFSPLPTEADLELHKSAPLSAEFGTSFTYTLTLINNGPAVATNVVVTDTLPDNVAADSLPNNCTEVNNVVTCTIASLAVNATEIITFDVSLTSESLFYTMEGHNGAPFTTWVTLIHDLPVNYSFQGDNLNACSFNNGQVSCELGFVNPGSSVPVTIEVISNDPVTITNTATVSADQSDSNTDNNSDTADTTIDPQNLPPTVDAGTNQTVTDNDNNGSENVTLAGSASDSDGTIQTIEWKLGGNVIASGSLNPTVNLPVGVHTIALVVTDNSSAQSQDTVIITVNEAPNQPPAVDAGSNQTVTDTDENGSENVTLSGSASDTDGTIQLIQWKLGGNVIASGALITTVNLPVGSHVITLEVTDNDNAMSSDTVTITVNSPVNQPPTVDAGSNQTVVDSNNNGNEDVTLNGTASDSDGTIQLIQWKLGGNVIASGTLTPTVNLPVGVNVVTLEVTDNDNAMSSDTVTITVNSPTNQPPTVDAGSDQTVTDSNNNGTESVTLSGSASDSDGTIQLIEWKIGATVLASNTLNPTLDFSVGVHVITLEVTDDDGAKSSDTVTVTVNAGQTSNQSVSYFNLINANNDSVIKQLVNGDTIDLSVYPAINIDAITSPVIVGSVVFEVNSVYEITENYKPYAIGTNIGASFQPWDIDPGVYTITAIPYTQTNGGGLPGTPLSITITIIDGQGNQPPTVDAGSNQTITDSDENGNENVTLSGSASDSDGSIQTIEWKLGGNVIASGSLNPTVNLPVGVNVITLEVTDNENAMSSDTVTITINAPVNQPPTVDAGSNQTVTDSDENGSENVTLSGSASDSDGSIQTIEWKLGGNVIASGSLNPTVNLTVGVHVITLEVTDNDNAMSTDTVTITVNAPVNLPPTVDAGSNQTVTDSDNNGTESVTLNGSASDSDGTIQLIQWKLGGNVIASGSLNPTVSLPVGVNVITLEVTDNDNAISSDTVTITVNAGQMSNQSVLYFNLINANTDSIISQMTNGMTIDLAQYPAINVDAITSPNIVGSVVFEVNGVHEVTENYKPYAIGTNAGASFLPWDVEPGIYTITAIPYTQTNGGGLPGTPLSLTVTIVNTAPSAAATTGAATVTVQAAPEVMSFTLVNAAEDTLLEEIVPVANQPYVINTSAMGTSEISLIANTSPQQVGSVVFTLNGQVIGTQNAFPYSLYDDDGNGDYFSWTPAPGTYVISATAYTEANGLGIAGAPLEITLTITAE